MSAVQIGQAIKGVKPPSITRLPAQRVILWSLWLHTKRANARAALVYEYSLDKLDLIELGVTYGLDGDWSKGEFVDGFYGTWMSLPDGQNLATYVVEVTEDYLLYTSPIRLNGEDTNLRKGDVPVPLYFGHDVKTGEDIPCHGNKYTVGDDFEIEHKMMEDGDYLYAFWIDDVFGDYYLTDSVAFFIDYGEVLFDPEQ